MKVVILLAVLVAACLAETNVHEEGQSGGQLIYRGFSGSHSSYWETEQKKKVRYPRDGEYEQKIGFLKIVDDWDSSYSTAEVKAGGVGHNYVEIQFYAPAFRGYKYWVELREKKV